jgi:hypothetical protein
MDGGCIFVSEWAGWLERSNDTNHDGVFWPGLHPRSKAMRAAVGPNQAGN